jgi:hypothetical protein
VGVGRGHSLSANGTLDCTDPFKAASRSCQWCPTTDVHVHRTYPEPLESIESGSGIYFNSAGPEKIQKSTRQGIGLGRRLLAFAEAEALRRGYREIRLYTHQKMLEINASTPLSVMKRWDAAPKPAMTASSCANSLMVSGPF